MRKARLRITKLSKNRKLASVNICLILLVYPTGIMALDCETSTASPSLISGISHIFFYKDSKKEQCEEYVFKHTNETLEIDSKYFEQSSDRDYRESINRIRKFSNTRFSNQLIPAQVSSDRNIKPVTDFKLRSLPGYINIEQGQID